METVIRLDYSSAEVVVQKLESSRLAIEQILSQLAARLHFLSASWEGTAANEFRANAERVMDLIFDQHQLLAKSVNILSTTIANFSDLEKELGRRW